jgi:hypothetical protein
VCTAPRVSVQLVLAWSDLLEGEEPLSARISFKSDSRPPHFPTPVLVEPAAFSMAKGRVLEEGDTEGSYTWLTFPTPPSPLNKPLLPKHRGRDNGLFHPTGGTGTAGSGGHQTTCARVTGVPVTDPSPARLQLFCS